MFLVEEQNTGEQYALKVVSRSHLRRQNALLYATKDEEDAASRRVMREIEVMQRLVHANVVRLEAVIDDPAVDGACFKTTYRYIYLLRILLTLWLAPPPRAARIYICPIYIHIEELYIVEECVVSDALLFLFLSLSSLLLLTVFCLPFSAPLPRYVACGALMPEAGGPRGVASFGFERDELRGAIGERGTGSSASSRSSSIGSIGGGGGDRSLTGSGSLDQARRGSETAVRVHDELARGYLRDILRGLQVGASRLLTKLLCTADISCESFSQVDSSLPLIYYVS